MPLLAIVLAILMFSSPAALAADEPPSKPPVATPKPPAPAAKDSPLELPPTGEVESEFAAGDQQTGRELYDRFLRNRKRLRTFTQRGRVLSKDPGGNPQRVDFSIIAKDYRDANDDAVGDIFARIMLRFVGPREMERSAYLFVHRDRGQDDEFMYSPHRDRTMRVKLRGQSIAATDFTFDDFLVHLDDLDDARYRRLPDETVEGTSVFVVEATMLPGAETGYSRSIQYLEKQHYVPLRTRYWDRSEVESKLLTAPHASIREFDGIWISTEIQALDLIEQTTSTLHVDELEPSAVIDDTELSISRLSAAP